MTSTVPPWERALRDATAQCAAIDAGESRVQGIEGPVRGLLDVFPGNPELQERARRRLVRQLNESPINQAAKSWLPEGWDNDNVLHVINLMLWAGTEEGVLPGYWQTVDQLAGLLVDMGRWNPAYVMAFLENPESPQESDFEVSLHVEHLTLADSAVGAAAILLEQLDCAARNFVER